MRTENLTRRLLLYMQCPSMPQLAGDDVVRLATEIEKGRRFLAQSRAYLYVWYLYHILLLSECCAMQFLSFVLIGI